MIFFCVVFYLIELIDTQIKFHLPTNNDFFAIVANCASLIDSDIWSLNYTLPSGIDHNAGFRTSLSARTAAYGCAD